jgi:hypothetical protein
MIRMPDVGFGVLAAALFLSVTAPKSIDEILGLTSMRNMVNQVNRR